MEGIELIDEIEGKINIGSSELINFLPKEYFENSSGFLPINFSFKKKMTIDLRVSVKPDQFKLESKLLGENLNFSNGKLRFIISPYGDNVSGFFDVKTKNIDIEVNTILSGLKYRTLRF